MMKTSLKKSISVLLIFAVCIGFLSGCADNNLPLKAAFNAQFSALSYTSTTNFTFKINDKLLDRGDSAYSDVFAFAENSSISLTNTVYINPGRQSGIIATDVDYMFSDDFSTNLNYKYNFHVDTSFDIASLTKDSTPKMKLVQSYNFSSVPDWLRAQLPDRAETKYFVLDLSNNEIIKDYLVKSIAKKAPVLDKILATLTWTRLNEKSYKLQLSDSDIKGALELFLVNSLFSPLGEQDQRRWNNAFDAFNFESTLLKYELADGRFKTKTATLNLTFDYFKLMNNVLGRQTGRQIKVPLIVTMETTYSSWNEVEKIYPPISTTENQLLFSQIPIKDVLPKVYTLPDLYTEDKIVVNIDGKKVDFLASLPPIIYNDRILLPMKYMFETQGVTTTSREISGVLQASAMIGIKSVTVTKDSNLASIMGQTVELPSPVGMAYDTFYMPVKLFSECFDMQEPKTEVTLLEDGTERFTINYVSGT